jgi:hypothetical protein
MKKMFFFKTDEQRELIAKHKLECDYEVGTTTYFTQITEDSTHIFLLALKDTGAILQKWTFANDVCVFVSKPTNKGESNEVDCNSASFEDGITCTDISNDNNLKCFLCEKADNQGSSGS